MYCVSVITVLLLGTVPQSWPEKGDIKYEGVSLRYDANRESIITNMNLHVPAGQKVSSISHISYVNLFRKH